MINLKPGFYWVRFKAVIGKPWKPTIAFYKEGDEQPFKAVGKDFSFTTDEVEILSERISEPEAHV